MNEEINPGSPLQFTEQKDVSTYQTGHSSESAVVQAPVHGLHSFLYLVNFFTLAWLATGVGTILYQLVNKYVDDPLGSSAYGYYNGAAFTQFALKYGIATIIIAGPIYFSIVYVITKFLREGKISSISKVRSWITYIILFIVSAVVIGDLIMLVYQWLGGGLLLKSFLKSLIVLFISGFIFTYYFWDMRNTHGTIRNTTNKIFYLFAIFLTGVTLIFGFMNMKSPAATRELNEDKQTLSAIKNARSSIESYYSLNNVLPQTLAEANKGRSNVPESKVTYTPNGISYELCADFKRASDDQEDADYYGAGYRNDEWKHTKGNHCFPLTVTIKPQSTRTNAQQNVIPTATPPTAPLNMNTTSSDPAKVKELRALIDASHTAVMQCINDGGSILTGTSNTYLCSKENGLQWPDMGLLCGDTASVKHQWLVSHAGSWSYTLGCPPIPECSGTSNVVCTKEGCLSPSGRCSK